MGFRYLIRWLLVAVAVAAADPVVPAGAFASVRHVGVVAAPVDTTEPSGTQAAPPPADPVSGLGVTMFIATLGALATWGGLLYLSARRARRKQ